MTDPHWFGSLDPNPDLPGVKSWIRIRIKTSADPQHCPIHKLRWLSDISGCGPTIARRSSWRRTMDRLLYTTTIPVTTQVFPAYFPRFKANCTLKSKQGHFRFKTFKFSSFIFPSLCCGSFWCRSGSDFPFWCLSGFGSCSSFYTFGISFIFFNFFSQQCQFTLFIFLFSIIDVIIFFGNT
jgi:hypothetical protein